MSESRIRTRTRAKRLSEGFWSTSGDVGEVARVQPQPGAGDLRKRGRQVDRRDARRPLLRCTHARLHSVVWACLFCRGEDILTTKRSRTPRDIQQRGHEGDTFRSAGIRPSVCRELKTRALLRSTS